MTSVISYLLFALGIMLIMCTILQLTRKGKTRINYIMSLMFFLFAFYMFYDWTSHVGILDMFPLAMYSDIAVSFLLGPVIYTYTMNITVKSYRYTVIYLLRFVPFVLVFFFIIYFNPGGDTLPAGSLYPEGHSHFLYLFIISLLSDVQLFVYLLLSAKMIFRIMKPGGFFSDRVALLIFCFYAVMLLSFPLFFLSYFFYDYNLVGTALILNGFDGLYLLLLSFRYSDYFQRGMKMQTAKAMQSILGGIDVKAVIEHLNHLLDIEKIYRSPNITIQSLSNKLSIKTYQLSEILNKHMNMNFRTLINSYRLKEVQYLLVNYPEKSILEIAYTVGFNSKSSFNDIFSKETGITPKEFRKKNKK